MLANKCVSNLGTVVQMCREVAGEGSDGKRGLVGFDEKAVGGGDGEGVGVEFFAIGEVKAVAQEFVGELWLAAEAVYDPRL